jgi:hypothetical protein
MALAKFKRTFENKLLDGWGFLCEKVSIVPVKANNKRYRFLRLDGNIGKKGPPPFDREEENKTFYFLITENRFLRKRTNDHFPNSFMEKHQKARFGTVKKARYEIEQTATDPNPSTCMMVEMNHTNHEASLNNISVHSFCNIENMDEIMQLFDTLLKKEKWKGRVTLVDNAKKNGVRVAVYYMRKHKDDPTKFSKYQDYGFNVPTKSLPELRKIKKDVLKLTDEAATKKYHEKLGILLWGMFKE